MISPITSCQILDSSKLKEFANDNFKFDKKWQKVIQMGRKHCGKRRNCSLGAISPFPMMFQKACFPRASKGVIVWEWVKGTNNGYENECSPFKACRLFMSLRKMPFDIILGKEENTNN